MPDLLVRDIDEDTYARMKQHAKAQNKSLAQTARETLTTRFKAADKAEIWAAADRLRAKIGKVSGDSTDDIREHRDNNERYR